MRYDQLARQLKAYPERYLWFGAYWWVMKPALRDAGYDFGPDDHPGIRAELEAHCGGEDAAIAQAMHVYADNAGALPAHADTLPSGEAVFVHDGDHPWL